MARDPGRPVREAWIVEAVRTPVGRYGGALASVRPDDLQKVLTQFGKQPADLSVAVGGTSKASVFAFRIKGVDANQMFGAFAAAQGSDVGTVTDVTIAGKAAKKVVDSSGTVLYLYATGDALITISSTDDGLTDAVLNEIFQNLR